MAQVKCENCRKLHQDIVDGKASLLPNKCYPNGGFACKYIDLLAPKVVLTLSRVEDLLNVLAQKDAEIARYKECHEQMIDIVCDLYDENAKRDAEIERMKGERDSWKHTSMSANADYELALAKQTGEIFKTLEDENIIAWGHLDDPRRPVYQQLKDRYLGKDGK